MKGVREKRDRGPEDTQLIWINPEEVVLTPEMKRKNKEALEYMFKTGGTLEEFYSKKYTKPETKILYDVKIQQTELASELKEIKQILKTTKLVDIRNLNKIVIEDNRKVQVQKYEWVGR
jgi:hypothetical protein